MQFFGGGKCNSTHTYGKMKRAAVVCEDKKHDSFYGRFLWVANAIQSIHIERRRRGKRKVNIKK